MKNIKYIIIGIIVFIFGAVILNGCVATKEASEKSGAQLWGENCNRCHNAPSPTTYTADQWEVVGIHMKSRTMIPNRDIQKIVAFLKEASK